jgi:hypothetical protein
MDNTLMEEIFASPPEQAWERIFKHLWQIFSQPMGRDVADSETVRRDRSAAALDNLLSGSAWDLWQHFETAAPATCEYLKQFWVRHTGGKAILILDALSLREAPWLLEQAAQRGFTLHCTQATASELPGDTTPFAKALGFSQRSALEHNQGSSVHFPDAWTESTELPFADCAELIKADPNIFFWHHWPDCQMHKLAGEGNGYRTLARAAVQQLSSDDFWGFIERLATGRRVIITSDHGYAHSGLFPDIIQDDQRNFLKSRFKSGRSALINGQPQPHYWVPPLTQRLNTRHGIWSLVLGRKKWRSQGGYPTLTHGGLSLLEVAVPYIELLK